ncbi:methyltransferase domain-containing protein [Chitinophaga sp. Mgbs1]|uniref:Methyltransferase domain-containing protein n=2 Tax=Chitinophaga solisilvae TaxID=1233460 RepID=A0A433WLC6_9BACT|nr:methyltransferase domain-containing protein [Chitinophaga solisilvae]
MVLRATEKKLIQSLKDSSDWKLVIGASKVFESGWIPTEVQHFNLLLPDTWNKYIPDNSVSAFLAEHVWEHLTYEEGLTAAKTCHRYLKPGGYLRIAIPDGFHSDPAYINIVKPGGTGWGADDHKLLYNYRLLTTLLENAGFREVKLLEYFDEQGQFHFNEWKKEDGMVHRSKRYDERNVDGKLNYTSIIVDAVK